MDWVKKLKELLYFDTFGAIAISSFLLCVVSGIVLAIPYDVNEPYISISQILITNPSATWFRNMHYWSAQLFLVCSILHVWDHLAKGSEKNQKNGVWLRLSISILFIFFLMITGFILKGDPDSLQARRIISGWMESIPVIGKLLDAALLGTEGDFQVIYVHHIATATLFISIIIWEHTKSGWAELSGFLKLTALLTLISVFFHAPLHDNLNPVVKGPWYLVGMQEILHWMSNPVWLLFIILLLISGIYLLYFFCDYAGSLFKTFLFILFFFYSVLTVIGYFFRGENWSWQLPWENKYIIADPFRTGPDLSAIVFEDSIGAELQNIRGRKEACMICHADIQGLGNSHHPQAIGCTSCHLGDPFTLDKRRAHRNMVLIPGNLHNSHETCGASGCHPEIVTRLHRSLMTTNSGIVSVNRFVFRETESPDIFWHIQQIGHSAADEHLRNLCANCHLGNEKTETGPVDGLTRGGGCNACHLNYSAETIALHNSYIQGSKNEKLLPRIHPSLDLKITNDHCFGCHSRSGRISTNYEGWHETLLDEDEVTDKPEYRILKDKRVFEFIGNDVHHEKGLVCIDCHTSYELMGDGNLYLHEEQALKVACYDCHFTFVNQTVFYDQLDMESRKIFDLQKFEHKDKPLLTTKNENHALVNAFIDGKNKILTGKIDSKNHPLNPPAPICIKDQAHGSLTCNACHSAWAPHCIGCHNAYENKTAGYDLLLNKPKEGTWIEFAGKFIAGQPTLGVRTGNKLQIEPCIPGMVISIEKQGFGKSVTSPSAIFHRLYAPVAPHTTAAKGRKCKSCHSDPLAIGYGRGNLLFEITGNIGKWKFYPEYAPNQYDGLPEDAWIGFLSEPQGIASTRLDFRPFTIEEQKKILTVGACLNCHDENSSIMMKSLDVAFPEYLKSLNAKCIKPVWQ